MILTEAGQVKLAQVKYLWTIPNFPKIYRESKYIYSPPFPMIMDNVELKFALLMRQKVTAGGKPNYINICMVRNIDEHPTSIKDEFNNAKIEFAVLDAFDNVVYRFGVTKNYPHSKVLVDLAIDEAMIFENENCLLKNELRLVWIITTNECVGVVNRIQAEQNARMLRLREFDNFGEMLNNQNFSDVILSVNDRDIHAHKVILANKSPVFEAMFTHDMTEARTSRVKIIDIQYDTMLDILRFFYTGRLSDDKESDAFIKYSNILVAANKYNVDSLKKRCEEKLLSILTIENVLECVCLADTHNAYSLKAQAIGFITRNAEKIIDLPSRCFDRNYTRFKR